MQVFRKKYLYNAENPIFQSANVQTFNCMNTETKDNKLILLKHLDEAPFVDPNPAILQPLETPTSSEPFSVYPLVYCCSEIEKTNEADVMYIIKCLSESKIKNPLYQVVSPQGFCCSQVEGILPNRSPTLFELAVDLLGIPETLIQSEKTVVSKEAYQICRAIKEGTSYSNLISNYGWKNPKKQKDILKDNQFWIFKGRRNQESPFGEQYGLAWFATFGLAKFKYIDLSKDGFEEEFYNNYVDKIEFYKNNKDKNINTVEIYKYVKEPKGIKLFTEILNEGTLTQYITKKNQLGYTLNEKNTIGILDNFVTTMMNLRETEIFAHGALHIKNLYVHNNRIVLGEPLLITDRAEKKLRQLKNTFDYFAPEMKENIILPENLLKLDFQRMDIWSFGMILHKIITRDVPIFDPTRKPIFQKGHFSPGVSDLIMRCLSLSPSARPTWKQINLRQLQKAVVVEEFHESANEREDIRLGSRKQRRVEEVSEGSKKTKKQSVVEIISQERNMKMQQENEKLKQQEEEEKIITPIPLQISTRLKKIKLIVKIIAVMLLYIFIFFRKFIANSFGILLVRSYYSTTSLNLIDNSNNVLSTTTIITNNPNFFLLNDISFSDLQNVYNCINNQFDPVYNPTYSLLTYVQSSSFLALLITGWATLIIICAIKIISIWKGGISNRPNKSLAKYWVVYVFHELSLAALLFAHFYIYEFFYFASGTPCFSINTFTGLQPFFDSSLYLFLLNTTGYLQKVFSSLGVLAILLALSSCYYAWGPKLDQKYFLSIPSILFRIIPYILMIVMCRIGVFKLFSPTPLNDPTQILSSLLTGSVEGFFGIVPEIFILICLVTEALLELLMYFCQRKAAQSDKLSKLFNIKSKKSIVTNNEESKQNLNEMSMLKNSQHPIAQDEEMFN